MQDFTLDASKQIMDNKNMARKTQWSVTDLSQSKPLLDLEFQDNKGESQHFNLLDTPDKIVFGGCCNAGFLESGFIAKEDGEYL